MLLKELIKNINFETQIISVDISKTVLKYDRIKFKGLNDKVKINYISCDALELPILDNAIDMAVSFVGLFNMVDGMLQGIEQVHSVIKEEGCLLNIDFVVEDNSNGYRNMNEYFNEKNIIIPQKFATLDGINLMYTKSKFKDYKIEIIKEGIGIKHDTGLIPFEGEWFGLIIINSVKTMVS